MNHDLHLTDIFGVGGGTTYKIFVEKLFCAISFCQGSGSSLSN